MRRSLMVLALLVVGAEAQAKYPGALLPRSGKGYFVPDTWSARGLRYGRNELLGLIKRSAARVAGRFAGSRLYVGDLSLKSGAPTQWHRTHKNGVDADLIFYALDEAGRPAPPPSQMTVYDREGRGVSPDGLKLRFDTKRNWALVKALIMDPDVTVDRIYVADSLRARLLAHGARVGDEAALLARAAEVMHQPRLAAPHDDHFHVRIAEPVRAARRR